MTKLVMEGERDTKRVKLAHNPTIRTNSATVQRRLRKMSEEFQPSSFSFLVQARVLCVGMAVVYRVALSLTITTTCTSTNGSTTSGSGETSHAWVIAMSQAKFRAFYAQVSVILQQPAVRQYLEPEDAQQQQLDGEVEWKPFEVFLRLLSEVFARYDHLRSAAFAIQADADTMNAGKVALEGFLAGCWRALEVIMPVLVVEPYLPTPLGREVLYIYLLTRDFLSLPESVLDANCTYANAILSLEDVEDLRPTHSEHACSICLELLVSSVAKGLSLASSNNSSGSSSSSSSSDSDELVAPATDAHNGEFSVKLPCAHVFHENCIMSWLCHNPSCPECRATVGATL